MVIDLQERLTQAGFGEAVGISQQAVSKLILVGVLSADGTAGVWLLEYCGHLREIAAGRAGEIDLATERALLARAQRRGQEIKNAVADGAYAPIELLADVLATASQTVVDRLEQIPADLRRACPDLPQAARDAVMTEIASARNEMARKTLTLVDERLSNLDLPEDDIAADQGGDQD